MVHIQKSFSKNQSPTLYIVPTPIGNLDDMTFRAVDVLKQVDLIACEDTRQTKKLLNHFEIEKSLVSFHEHSEEAKRASLIDDLREGKSIALVSDAGMPLISDPGYTLVRDAREEGLHVVVLPGANAALTALVGSGLPTDAFTFAGFLPKKDQDLRNRLKELDRTGHTLIFYESPYRVKQTLKRMNDVYQSSRRVTLARELTKTFEEYVSGTIEEVYEWACSNDATIRGEFCITVEPADHTEEEEDHWWASWSVIEHVDYYKSKEDIKTKAAVKKVALDRGVSSRDIYDAYHES
ncbi:16S rRNA (cytidine(1402)-2'-O)-methyltransferase [Alkalibacillus salilacus]|uniref:Ribosomal RNA small subunit methyltransferase I n=1 Tax=Alkalibacillus salilacus TaxID=284582 RepID=A0ABT9VC32_9BACI|nr:16S rRNA (cytidine(1402)-2'-O)-methyltransferase [Alkalibacillus salilacus]MDQ0158435.1 16S rRNA (cytidine1402-2'-O)-methyltransferase [Alkalibacillus salilacus]